MANKKSVYVFFVKLLSEASSRAEIAQAKKTENILNLK